MGLKPRSNAMKTNNLVPRFDLSRFNPDVGNPFRYQREADNTPDFGPPRDFPMFEERGLAGGGDFLKPPSGSVRANDRALMNPGALLSLNSHGTGGEKIPVHVQPDCGVIISAKAIRGTRRAQ